MVKRILGLIGIIISVHLNAQTGIGTTSPVNKFQIETTASAPLTSGTGFNGNLRLGATSANQVMDFGLGTSYGWIQSRDKTAYGTNYNLLLNPNGGSVGVGTSNPQSIFHVKNGYIRLEYSSGPYFDFMHSSASTDQKIRRIGSYNGDMIFDKVNDAYNSSNEQMRITSGGNVGIGTTAPAEKLEVSGNVKATNFIGSGSQLTDIANRTTGSWNVTTGNNNYSFTVSAGSYVMWVYANIPNGIIAWNATVSVTNSNVPVVGSQYAWVYNGGGTPIDFTSIPNQITGTNNSIIRSTISGSTSNTFTFGINNTSGSSQTVYYGYIRL
jgi:hypothetical protein